MLPKFDGRKLSTSCSMFLAKTFCSMFLQKKSMILPKKKYVFAGGEIGGCVFVMMVNISNCFGCEL